MDDRSRERFEEIWAEEGYRHLQADAAWRSVGDGYKMRSWADRLLFLVPLLAGVAFVDLAPISSELFRWLATAGVVIVAFVLCAWIKTAIGGVGSAAEAERRVKERCFRNFVEHGTLD